MKYEARHDVPHPGTHSNMYAPTLRYISGTEYQYAVTNMSHEI